MGANYSEKLKIAMAEIKIILNNHDIAGLIFLYDDHLSEYLLKPETTKSVISLKDNKLRFRSKLEEFGGSIENKKMADEYSVGMIKHFIELIKFHNCVLVDLYKELSDIIKIEHSDGIHTPHIEH